MFINDPLVSRGARVIGTYCCLEPLRIVAGVDVVLKLDLVVALKAIARKNKFMHGVVGFKGMHTTDVKIVFFCYL